MDHLIGKLERLDKRIEELASGEEYRVNVQKFSCFLGVKTQTALSTIVEVGEFNRFVTAQKFASYLGLVPGEDSSGNDRQGLGIIKARNTHVHRLLVESARAIAAGALDTNKGTKGPASRKHPTSNCICR